MNDRFKRRIRELSLWRDGPINWEYSLFLTNNFKIYWNETINQMKIRPGYHQEESVDEKYLFIYSIKNGVIYMSQGTVVTQITCI